jgi:molybdate transport system substrate-binding protein
MFETGRVGLAALLTLLAASPLRAAEVTVCAAASLADALREIGTAYEASSGNKVVFNLGASSDLARQIRAGAPADLFFSADQAQMDVLERAGLVKAADRVDVLSNVLVVVVPAEGGKVLRTPSDLLSLERLALADPQAVPAGVYARTYLESKGLWKKLEGKVVPTLNVRAALAAVESGHVDAGIVYRTDAAISSRVAVAFEIAREEGPRIVYVLAPLAASTRPVTRDLVRYLVSPDAIKVYERYGFLTTIGKPTR